MHNKCVNNNQQLVLRILKMFMDMEKLKRRHKKKQINYITIKKRFRDVVLYWNTYLSDNCGCNHLTFICKLKIKLQRLKQPKQQLNYKTNFSMTKVAKRSILVELKANIIWMRLGIQNEIH